MSEIFRYLSFQSSSQLYWRGGMLWLILEVLVSTRNRAFDFLFIGKYWLKWFKISSFSMCSSWVKKLYILVCPVKKNPLGLILILLVKESWKTCYGCELSQWVPTVSHGPFHENCSAKKSHSVINIEINLGTT